MNTYQELDEHTSLVNQNLEETLNDELPCWGQHLHQEKHPRYHQRSRKRSSMPRRTTHTCINEVRPKDPSCIHNYSKYSRKKASLKGNKHQSCNSQGHFLGNIFHPFNIGLTCIFIQVSYASSCSLDCIVHCI